MHLHQASSPPAQGLLWPLEFSPGQALLAALQPCASLEGPEASQTGSKSHVHWGVLASAHALSLHSPRLILCLSQDISSISWRNFRGARHNKNMARILWRNEKAIAGQGLTWHQMVPSRHLSHHKPCFISGETGTTGA